MTSKSLLCLRGLWFLYEKDIVFYSAKRQGFIFPLIINILNNGGISISYTFTNVLAPQLFKLENYIFWYNVPYSVLWIWSTNAKEGYKIHTIAISSSDEDSPRTLPLQNHKHSTLLNLVFSESYRRGWKLKRYNKIHTNVKIIVSY